MPERKRFFPVDPFPYPEEGDYHDNSDNGDGAEGGAPAWLMSDV